MLMTDVMHARNETKAFVRSFVRWFVQSVTRIHRHKLWVCGDVCENHKKEATNKLAIPFPPIATAVVDSKRTKETRRIYRIDENG